VKKTRLGSASVLACVAGSVAVVHAAPEDSPWRTVRWQNANGVAAFDAARPVEAPAQALARLAGPESRVIVEFDEIPTPARRAALADAGVTLLAPLGGPAYFARIDADANPGLAARAAALRSVREIGRAHKIESKLVGAEAPAWALADRAQEGVENPVIGVYVQLHADVDPAADAVKQMIAGSDGVVRDTVESINTLVVELPWLSVPGLADDPRVQWVEAALPRLGTTNASNRARVQADQAQAAPYNLDGSGVTVLVYDGGTVRTTHQDYSGRATNIDGDSVSYHATHVAGTIGGDGTANATHRGMAPGVTILGAGFQYDGSGTFLYTNPGDLEFDYGNGIAQGAVMSNNSIGSNIAPNGFPCAYEGDYGLTAATIDAVVGGSLGEPIVIFWAAGNERGNGCGNLYNTSPPPANNKNAITVGALNSNDDSMTSFSSWGPSDDGRIRPVISAPGCQSGGDGGVTSLDDDFDTDYTTLCGTSMASPTACGVGALIYDDFRAGNPGAEDPSNQLMKAWLCHTSADLGNPGPDNRFGYGSVRAVDAIDFVRTGSFDEGSVENGGIQTFTVDVAPGEPELKLTLAWDDAPGTPNTSPSLVNDLDLVVVDPSGGRHFPWTIDPADPGSPAVRTQEDHLNNIEQVQVDNPEAGRWMIQVVGTAVPAGPQGFALASTPNLGPGLLAVSLTTDVPDLLAPATPVEVVAAIEPGIDTLVPGSVTLHYRFDGGAYTEIAMSDSGGGDYSGTVPGAACDELMEFFITAEGEDAGIVSVPAGSSPFAVEIGEIETVLVDNMETDMGWTVSGDATDGMWERGVPVNCSSRGAPGADADGSGQCWVTDNSAASSCNSDVDSGTTYLTSPVYDISEGGEVSFSYWFSDIASGGINGDEWGVDASTDGGATWQRLRTVTSVAAVWRSDTILVGDEIEATDQMRFRFSANDVGTQNVIEAGLDDLRIQRFVCEDAAAGCNAADLTEPFDVLDLGDVQAFLAGFTGQDPIADLVAPFGVWDLGDVQAFIGAFNAGCP
jgi:hypothetical protein